MTNDCDHVWVRGITVNLCVQCGKTVGAFDEFREAGREVVHQIGKRLVPVVEPIVHALARALGWLR